MKAIVHDPRTSSTAGRDCKLQRSDASRDHPVCRFGTPIVSSGLYQRLCVQRATRQISVLDAWHGLQWNSVLHRIQCADVMGPGNPA